MNKAETIEAVAAASEVDKKVVAEVIDGFIAVTTKALKKGEEINLTGFGKWSAKKRAARKGVNPKTGDKIKIAARTVVKFTVGKSLKDTVHPPKK